MYSPEIDQVAQKLQTEKENFVKVQTQNIYWSSFVDETAISKNSKKKNNIKYDDAINYNISWI